MQTEHLMICHDCDLIQKKPETDIHGTIRCLQCNAVLEKNRTETTDITLSLTLTGIILFVLINLFPFLTFQMGGQMQETTLITGIQMFFRQGWWPLGILVFFVTILAPALHLSGLLYILLPIRLADRLPARLPRALRLIKFIQPWSMSEIFMLGIFVTVVKLTGDGEITPGLSLYAFMVFTFVQAALFHYFHPLYFWKKWDTAQQQTPAVSADCHEKMLCCHTCNYLCAMERKFDPILNCPRCGSVVHERKRNSISRTWSLVLTAVIFYIPANVYPITNIISFGDYTTDTILSGVIYFVKTGMWPLALIIFVASIFVPLLKLIILIFLLITVQLKSTWRPKDRTRIYRITEAIGRWSMVDIFAITVLIALVDMGSLATVRVEPAALYFAAVVIFTMLAAMTFDPKLIWDVEENNHA